MADDDQSASAPRATDTSNQARRETSAVAPLTGTTSDDVVVPAQKAQDSAHPASTVQVHILEETSYPELEPAAPEQEALSPPAARADALYNHLLPQGGGADVSSQDAQHHARVSGQALTTEGQPTWVGEPVPQSTQEVDSINDDSASVPLPPNDSSIADIAFLDSAASVVESEGPRIQAFAKLEFDDGQFYMNTYSVELGRDIRAARAVIHHNLETHHGRDGQGHKRSNSSADASQTPRRLKHEESRNMAGSVVSESGGIMGVDVPSTEHKRRSKNRKSKSTSSSSYNLSRKSSMLVSAPQTDYQSLAMASLSHGAYSAQPVDTLALLPSPDECPLIPIHPPTVAEGSGHRGISRRHVKIAYNFEKRLFEVEVMGKNGAFVDEQFYGEGEVQELKSGSYIQIGGVGVKFVLPDVAIGETGAESHFGSDPVSGGAMSFDFEDGRGESITMADSSEDTTGEDDRSSQDEDELEIGNTNDDQKVSIEMNENEDELEDEEEDEGNGEEDEDEEIEEVETAPRRPARRPKKPHKSSRPKIKLKLSAKPKPKSESEPVPNIDPLVVPPKRKGPGRPPKNGIISKREQALIARAAREAAKAEAIKNGLIKPGKGKAGNAHNDPNAPSLGLDGKVEKRKYTKRKKPEDRTEDSNGVRETTEKTESMPPEQNLPAQPPKPVKEKRPPKPPRSPSPVWDESTLTAEQLAKPSQSYVVLIHEALTNSKTGAMSLPQIYRAIERRYPFYKLRVTTTGWQSSVRHNLSQHPAFRKIERDGKGWMWGLVPEISIEKEKKRRPTPPLMPPQGYYPPGPPHMYRHPYPYPGMPPPPNGHIPPPPPGHPAYGMHPGMPPPPPGHGYPPNVGLPRGPNGIPLPLAPPQNDQASTYQSPYTPAPQTKQPPPPQTQPPTPTQQTLQNQQSPQPQQPQESSHSQPSTQPQHISQTQPPQEPHPSHASTQPPRAHDTKQQQQVPAPPPPPPYYQTPQLHPPSSPHAHAPPSAQTSMASSLLDAVAKFKTALIASMPDKPNAEEIVTQAINRTLGITPSSSNASPPKEYPEEKAIMQALTNMLSAISKKEKEKEKEKASRQVSIPPSLSQPSIQGQAQGQQAPMPPPQNTQAQAQLLQLLQHIGRRNTTPSPAPARSPSQNLQQSSSPAPPPQTNGALPPSTEAVASSAMGSDPAVKTESAPSVKPEEGVLSDVTKGLAGSKRPLEEEEEEEEENPATGAGDVGVEGRGFKRVAV